ncbi:MAG: hypothetical protein HWD85_00080 [Flavobacteriaceae bacterium]|nr:hypothetical protein [Flavobacteriaceae bacterium]
MKTNESKDTNELIKKLEKRQKAHLLLIIFLFTTNAVLFFGLSTNTKEDVITAKGIVIVDDYGNPRIKMGFPFDNRSRIRKDTLSGMVFMDEKGMDRIHLGPHGKLFLGNKYFDRANEGWSLFFNDSNGEERSGYGFSDDDNSVGLGMDYGGEDGGEAIYLYAAPNIAFMTINADLPENQGIRDRIVLWHETDKDLSIAKISDSKKDGRITLKAEKGNNPLVQTTDSLSINKKIN